jgi:MFS family permease
MLQKDSTTLSAAEQAPPALPLWRNRDFLLLVSGQGVSSIGTQVSQLAFPLLMLAVTHSPAQAGLLTALRSLTYVLLCLPAGALVDRWDRKRVMILCDTGRALALGSIPLALAFGLLSLPQLYLVSLAEGTLFVFFQMAEYAALPHVVTKEQLPAATGQNEMLYSTALLLGPPLGGALYSIAHMLPFLGDAVSYAASVLSLFFIKTKFQGARESTSQQRLWADVKIGLSWLWHNPLLRFLAILTCGLTAPCAGYALILIVIAQGQHASATVIGLIFAGAGVGSIVGAALASPLQRRFGFARLVPAVAWVWALTWLLIPLAPNPLLLGIINGLAYAIVPVYTVTQYSYRIALIPEHLQGRVNSVFRLISFGCQPLGMALTGVLLQIVGPVPTIVLLFIPQAVVAFAASMNRHLRHARPIEELV